MTLIALAQEVRQLASELGHREQLQAQLSSTQQTWQRASEVLDRAQSLAKSLQAVTDLLSESEKDLVQEKARNLHEQTLKVISDLTQNPKQTEPLSRIKQALDDLERSLLSTVWQRYARHAVAQRRDLFTLVRSLPEFASRSSDLSGQIADLDTASATLPKDRKRREQFEQRLRELDTQLSVVSLSADIQTFLQRVVLRTATAADISDVVLAWLREGGHASAFRISFQ